MASQPEVWLRGPVPDVSPWLQPVAHSLLQCREEVSAALATADESALWGRQGSAALAAYHVRHSIGALDRLLTYARGESLSAEQTAAARTEGSRDTGPTTATELITAFGAAIDRALAQLQTTDDVTLLDHRAVGRAQLPSTVLGLLFHAAEHTQRHAGQLVTTLRAGASSA